MTPSPWLEACLGEIEAARALGPVVDLACGRGRNALALLARDVPVVGVDRNAAHLAELGRAAARHAAACHRVRADLEAEAGFPIGSGTCGAILVFRFLYRPLADRIVSALAPGGVLVYETFTIHQRELGYGPRSEAFLLQPGELPTLFPQLRVEAHVETTEERGERPEAVARLLARKPEAPGRAAR